MDSVIRMFLTAFRKIMVRSATCLVDMSGMFESGVFVQDYLIIFCSLDDPREHAQYTESISNDFKGFLSPEWHT